MDCISGREQFLKNKNKYQNILYYEKNLFPYCTCKYDGLICHGPGWGKFG